MPPRTRKTAASATPPEDKTTENTEPAETSPAEPETATAADTTEAPTEPETADTSTAQATGDTAATDEQPAPDTDAETAPTVPAFHWESVKNDGTPPCHLCVPGGPPANVGTFGCSHGQWVRVTDTPAA
jgi:hypothetical protein